MVKYYLMGRDGDLTLCEDKKQAERLNYKGLNKIIVVKRKALSKTQKTNILVRQNHKCNICNEPLQEKYEFDHIHPMSLAFCYKNGYENINEVSNIQALCRRCNRAKYNNISI